MRYLGWLCSLSYTAMFCIVARLRTGVAMYSTASAMKSISRQELTSAFLSKSRGMEPALSIPTNISTPRSALTKHCVRLIHTLACPLRDFLRSLYSVETSSILLPDHSLSGQRGAACMSDSTDTCTPNFPSVRLVCDRTGGLSTLPRPHLSF